MYEYEYPRPMLTADAVVFSHNCSLPIWNCQLHAKANCPWEKWSLLLIKRANDPFKDCWALPGGFVKENEPARVAARRELQEETGLDYKEDITEIGAFSEPNRDPRGWVVSVAYYFIVNPEAKDVAEANDDAKDLKWFPITTEGEGGIPTTRCSKDTIILPGFFSKEKLAFDHHDIIMQALGLLDREFI